jgi:hypothetical protein
MLRHRHASDLLMSGVHPKVKQARLAQTAIATILDIHSHPIGGAQEASTAAAEQAMARVLGRNGNEDG